MDKKNFYVNLIIIVFIGFFVYSAFNLSKFTGAKDKNDFQKSIKIGGFELTPILISPSPTLSQMPDNNPNIFNNNNNSNFNNLENPTPTITSSLFSNPIKDLNHINYNIDNNSTPSSNVYQQNNNQKNNSYLENFVYYTQKTNYPIPPDNKCTMNKVGCGPTTVAMIVASYIDRNITPEKIVDHFLKNKYSLTCAGGSYFKDNKKALEDFGVKTTEIIVLTEKDPKKFFSNKNKITENIIINYIKNGWTIFAFAYFNKENLEKEFGHFFWIIDVDNEKILAYDPAYGKNINLYKYYPDIMYRGIFFVKK